MNTIRKELPLRVLARGRKWQTIFTLAKEIHNIKLFENNIDLTPIQLLFLEYLQVYYNLYIDISMGEEHIDEDVMNDWLRVDSYLYYKSKKRKEQLKEFKEGKNKINHKDNIDKFSDIPKIRYVKG